MGLKCTGLGRKELGYLDQLRIALGPREEAMEIRREYKSGPKSQCEARMFRRYQESQKITMEDEYMY